MPTKTCAVLVKATAADDSTLKEGQFTALASVFNNVDAVGDVVMPGAFAEDLKAWSASGDPIPLLWGHQMADPDMNLGKVLEAVETEAGLQIKAELDLDNLKSAQVYRLLKGRRVSKMSFAYDVEDGAPAERDGRSVYELRKLKLHEVSVVQVPANPAASIQQVKDAADRRKADLATDPQVVALLGQALDLLKAADPDTDETAHGLADDPVRLKRVLSGMDSEDIHLMMAALRAALDGRATDPEPPKSGAPASKAGRVLSAKNESTLRAGLDQIAGGMADVKSVLDSLDSKSNDGTANPATPVNVEEPSGVKTDSPAAHGPATSRLRTAIDQLAADVISHTD